MYWNPLLRQPIDRQKPTLLTNYQSIMLYYKEIMELLILLITLLLLAETSILLLKSRQKPLLSSQKRKIYIDTSALMDPRLVAVAQTGFISDDMIIPRSVIGELQLLADGKDHEKRMRARSGLDAVRELERVVHFNLTILDDPLDHTPVDNRLLELAKANRGAILTNDFNLQKVAATEHIDTLGLNALALVLRNEYLPGERASVKLIATGSGPSQGVGYLKDGTMVVVEKAKSRIGEEVEVEFQRLNQTAAGTMMFATLTPASAKSKTSSSSSSAKSKTAAASNAASAKAKTKTSASAKTRMSKTAKSPRLAKSKTYKKSS